MIAIARETVTPGDWQADVANMLSQFEEIEMASDILAQALDKLDSVFKDEGDTPDEF